MLCADSKVAHVAVLKAAFRLELDLYVVPFNAELGEILTDRLVGWWRRHVEQGEPLPPGPPPSMETLRRVRGVAGKTVQIPADPQLSYFLNAGAVEKPWQGSDSTDVTKG